MGGVNTGVMFSSKTCEWATPPDLFQAWDEKYHFGTDVCATAENAKCSHYYTKEQDGLRQEWSGMCWMNPPYGREIGAWVRKAWESAQCGATVVCLLPARTDTAWFHDYCKQAEVIFLRGRLKFGDARNSAPFPSMIVIFKGVGRR